VRTTARHPPAEGRYPDHGGTLILVTTLVSTLLWSELSNRLVWTVLGVTFAFGLIGFYDDYLKLLVRNPKGLVPAWKYLWQSVAGLATAATALLHRHRAGGDHAVSAVLSRPFTRRSRPSVSSCSPT